MSVAIASIGHNSPPDTISAAHDTMHALSDWMKERPEISSEDDAREAKRLLDRATSCADELEAERIKLVKPLNEQVDTINSRYKAIHNTDKKRPAILDKIVAELKDRLSCFLRAEEARREAVAEQKRLAAEEAERAAREAEAKEQEAIANAKAGELGVDVTQVVVEADSRFTEFKKANREAALAERESHVRIGGGWKRSASLRDKETLVLDSYSKAITAIGPHQKIEEAILSAAREYRKKHGVLPAGVSAAITRQV
jgi:hypothetical protein